MAKGLRDIYGEALMKYGVPQEDVLVMDADLSGSTKSILFGQAAPDRFFNVGIAESNMVAMAAGMASVGKNVFVNTFTSFLTTIGLCASKALISYGNLNVKLAGAYAGLSSAYDGPSHHALEDVAIMRSLPNMLVLCVCDNTQTEQLTKYLVEEHKGPAYLRLSREAVPSIYDASETFPIGKGKVVRDGSDITIIGMGVMVHKALEAAEELSKKGVSARVVDMYSIKPIDRDLIIQCAKETGAIITTEEHNIIGGLYSAVSEVLCAENIPVVSGGLGMNDHHAETGKYADLLEKFGFNAASIITKAEEVLAKKNA